MVKFCSSRGGELGKSLDDVIIAGYAEDGGLYVPQEIPQVDRSMLQKWRHLSYADLAAEIFGLYDSEELLGSVESFKELFREVFQCFYDPEVVKVKSLNDGTKILELFHGPTLAFKDLALIAMAPIVDALMEKRKGRCVALVATSGDTGSAAAMAVAQMKHADIVVLYPKGMITKTQQLQMTTIDAPNVHIIEGEGNSDELDVPVKLLTDDREFQKKYNLAIFNSINVLRILLQIPHFVYAYLRVLDDLDADEKQADDADDKGGFPTVTFAIPTGAAGNMAGGCFARAMGIPIKFVPCNNANAAVHDFIRMGAWKKPDTPALSTLACAMDIKAPYNVERVLYAISGGDSAAVRRFMAAFETSNNAVVPEDIMEVLTQTVPDTFVVSDATISATIRRCWDENGYMLCPHTATAVAYSYQQGDPTRDKRTICVATASPAKFPEALQSVDIEPPQHPAIANLRGKPEVNKTTMERELDWGAFLKKFVEENIPAN